VEIHPVMKMEVIRACGQEDQRKIKFLDGICAHRGESQPPQQGFAQT
jgi:hypothetical protein